MLVLFLINFNTFIPQDDIDMELPGDSPVDGGSGGNKDSTPKQSHDLRQTLQVMLQRQAKFLESCREVKVGH